MVKYSQSLAKRFAQDLNDPTVQLKSVCKKYNITKTTYYKWLDDKLYFADLIKKAKENHLDKIGELAETAIADGIQGHFVTEETIDIEYDSEGKILKKKHKKNKKYIPANATLIVWASKNAMPDKYRDRKEIAIEEVEDVETLREQISELMDELGYKDKPIDNDNGTEETQSP